MFPQSKILKRRTFLKTTSVAAAGTVLSNGVRGSTVAEQNDNPAVIAHRGFAGVAPENTVEAVRRAARGGDNDGSSPAADMVEIDVMPCKDGDVVVFHDDELSGRDGGERGLTDAEGVVWETPCETVRRAEVLESGETVPLLDEVLSAIPPHVGVNIELKNPGSFDIRFAEKLPADELAEQMNRWQPLVERVLDTLERHEHEVLFSSFYEAAIAVVRELDSSIPIAFLFWDSIEEGLEITRRHDCEAIHPPWNLIQGTPFFGDEYYLSGPFADIDLVSVAHEEGRDVNVWTVDDWYLADQLQKAGVDGLIADYPGLL